MRKVFFALAIALFILPLASASDFAYVVKNNLGVDNFLLQEVHNLGFTTDTILESQVSNTDFSQYRLIIVGNSNLENPTNVPVDKNRAIILDSHDYYKASSTDYQLGWSAGASAATGNLNLKVVNPTHPIAQSIPFEFRSYNFLTQAQTYKLSAGYAKPTGAVTIVSMESLSTDSVVAIVSPGARFLNGKTAQQRNVFFGLPEAQHWTPTTKKLFANSINWVLFGEDFDKDGFKSDVDCNDKDSSVFPGADEIPYDSIDQDCDGSDLDDWDEDGFSSTLVGGLDCDDFDELINPNNPDKTLNCINDAPVITSPSSISGRETDLVKITVLALDPEDNTLTYSINDSRFSQEGNIFTWQTDYGMEGTYKFKISVSDGLLTATKEVRIVLAKKNHPPQFNILPNLSWNEDTSATLNLSDYFSDLDGDSLIYGIGSTSDDQNIVVSSPSQGVFVFTQPANWHGEDYISFWATDLKKTTPSNTINLTVVSVNDAPIKIKPIENVTWNEDTLPNTLDLTEYFSDIDSDLVYSVSGNTNIQVSLASPTVSFSTPKDWFGNESIVFSVSDGEFTLDSNIVLLQVNEMGEPPELSPLDCQTDLLEDNEYSCVLEASDFENDTIVFSSSEETNLDCEILGNVLTYKSSLNYNGLASCKILASDNDGSDSKTLEVNVTAVNDSPQINSFSPSELIINLPVGVSKQFKINSSDVDSPMNISWQLNSAPASGTDSYTFNQPIGGYALMALISDGEFQASQVWTIIVGPISDFTCSQVSGFVCSETQVCTGSLLGVKDTSSCCSVACTKAPPTFRDANACDIKESSIKVDIKDPNSDKKIEAGDLITIRADIENNFEDDQKFDVEAHLYNLDEDTSVEEITDTLSINSGDKKTISFDLRIPDDIDVDAKFAIFVKAEDSACNQDYIELTELNRKPNNVFIDTINIPSEAVCGDILTARVKMINAGTSDESVVLRIQNSVLNIDEETPEFTLEKFDDKDTATEELILQIPSDAEAGEYTMKISADYDSYSDDQSAVIKILDCKKTTLVENNVSEEEALVLNPVTKQNEQATTGTSNSVFILLLSSTIITIVVVLGFVYLIVFRK